MFAGLVPEFIKAIERLLEKQEYPFAVTCTREMRLVITHQEELKPGDDMLQLLSSSEKERIKAGQKLLTDSGLHALKPQQVICHWSFPVEVQKGLADRSWEKPFYLPGLGMAVPTRPAALFFLARREGQSYEAVLYYLFEEMTSAPQLSPQATPEQPAPVSEQPALVSEQMAPVPEPTKCVIQ